MPVLLLTGCQSAPEPPPDVRLRVATFNIEDVWTRDILQESQPRLQRIADIIREIDPDILLLNEVAWDCEATDPDTCGPGMNAQRFADKYLPAASGKTYVGMSPPSNTGVASGYDLDNDGTIQTEIPAKSAPIPNGDPPPQTPEGRAYGNDSWGFGVFPGQYAMAILVRSDLAIEAEGVQSFRRFKWSAMPGALRPMDPATGESWYSDEEWGEMRLSSKTHIDVPVRLPNGKRLHILASHPTPPAFDGPEQRNKLRNHDEIRLLGDYLTGESYLENDLGSRGQLPLDASFVILGDLNADTDEGSSHDNPIQKWLLSNDRVNGSVVPESGFNSDRIDPDDTAGWGLRVDYVLPSSDLEIRDSGIHLYEGAIDRDRQVSDHFPVWIDLVVPSIRREAQ